MSVSVLTIVKDRAGHLARLVEGLCRSDAMPGELIIVDMGSTPPVTAMELPFPVRVVRLECEGLPLAAARNAAARAAGGDVLLFLDVDCIPMRGLIGAIRDVLRTQDALLCARVLYLGPDQARGEWDEADLLLRAQSHPARRFPIAGVRTEDDAALFWSLVFGIVRRRFLALGGFDEAFVGYGAEDTDFGFRAKAAGLPLLFMGGPGAFHQYHAGFVPPLQHLPDIVRNARVYHRKWGVWPMEGWLTAFARMGLISWSDDAIALLRPVTEGEMERAHTRTPVSEN